MSPMGGIPESVPRWYVVTAFRYWESLQTPGGVPIATTGLVWALEGLYNFMEIKCW